MDLAVFADEYLGGSGGHDFMSFGEFTHELHYMTGSETATTPIAASIFWQSFIGSERYKEVLGSIGASPRAPFEGEAFIVRHGEGWPRHDLLVFDPDLERGKVLVQKNIEASPVQLKTGWHEFQKKYQAKHGLGRYLARFFPGIANRFPGPQAVPWDKAAPEIANEVIKGQQFGLLVAAPPKILYTSILSPPMAVKLEHDSSDYSTTGVVARDKSGRYGVTGVLHATGPIGTEVHVNGMKGVVVSDDQPSDSCFIEVPGIETAKIRNTMGPLTGMTPRLHETVEFEGISTPDGKTIVTGVSPELPLEIPGRPPIILTEAKTNPGDSGAALIDGNGYVLGFAIYRTGFNEAPSFSAWVWASTVYRVNNIS